MYAKVANETARKYAIMETDDHVTIGQSADIIVLRHTLRSTGYSERHTGLSSA